MDVICHLLIFTICTRQEHVAKKLMKRLSNVRSPKKAKVPPSKKQRQDHDTEEFTTSYYNANSLHQLLFLSGLCSICPVLLFCFPFVLLCYFLSAIVSFLCLVLVLPCSLHVLSCVCLFMPCAPLLLSVSLPLTCSQLSPCLFHLCLVV